MSAHVWAIAIAGAVVLWFGLGWVSRCVRFGTWHKHPLVPLLHSGITGSLQLQWELFMAFLSGPVVAIKYLWMWHRGIPIGFKRVTPEAFAKFVEP